MPFLSSKASQTLTDEGDWTLLKELNKDWWKHLECRWNK